MLFDFQILFQMLYGFKEKKERKKKDLKPVQVEIKPGMEKSAYLEDWGSFHFPLRRPVVPAETSQRENATEVGGRTQRTLY